MRIRKRIFISFLTAFALLLLGCPDFVNTVSEEPIGGPVWEEPLTHEEFLALSHLDEHPVRNTEEVTAMVQDYIAAMAESLGASLTIGSPDFKGITMNSGFAEKAPGSDVETIPENSLVPFYRYAVTNAATNTTGTVIASGDKRVGNIIAYMVHCNLGWGGSRNGWYESRMFDTNEGIVDDVQRSVGGVQRSTVTTTQGDDDRYYRYRLQIIPYLKPNRN